MNAPNNTRESLFNQGRKLFGDSGPHNTLQNYNPNLSQGDLEQGFSYIRKAIYNRDQELKLWASNVEQWREDVQTAFVSGELQA